MTIWPTQPTELARWASSITLLGYTWRDRSRSATVSNYSPLTVGHRGRIGHSAGRVRRRDGQLALCSTAVPNLAEGEFPQRYSTFGRTSGLPAPLMDSDSAMSLTAESRS